MRLRHLRKLRPSDIRAAWWGLRALREANRRLRTQPLDVVVVPKPPRLPADAARALRPVLALGDQTCLAQSIVRQAWEMEHGSYRDLVIGISEDSSKFEAHAWLEGDDVEGVWREIARRSAARP
jgi:hypothetical protein